MFPAGVAHPVERHLAKVEVASSSLVTRSIRYRGQVVRQESAKLSFPSSNLGGTSKTKSTARAVLFVLETMRSAFAECDAHYVRDVACGSDARFAREWRNTLHHFAP